MLTFKDKLNVLKSEKAKLQNFKEKHSWKLKPDQ